MHSSLRLASIAVLIFSSVARGEEAAWQTDFAAAKTKAKAEKKLLLCDFTGSDWCVWCKKLKAEVFDQPEFQAFAPERFILVEFDFPNQKELPDELKTQNAALSKQYKVQGFPTVLLMDPEGHVVARTGYHPGGAEKYSTHLTELLKIHADVERWKSQLVALEGLDRAKLLDELVEASERLRLDDGQAELWGGEIIALDADNKAGLKSKYEFRDLMARAEKLVHGRKFDEAQKLLGQAARNLGHWRSPKATGLLRRKRLPPPPRRCGRRPGAF